MATTACVALRPQPPNTFKPSPSSSTSPTTPTLTPPISHTSPFRPPSTTTQPPSNHSPPTLTDSQKWSILTHRSATHATTFIYAVTSTKIYCRPTCPSRLARRSNITYFPPYPSGPTLAERQGFRACKRCKPDVAPDSAAHEEEGARKVERAVEIVRAKAERGEKVELAELAGEVGLSKWHLLRCFKRRVGVSPREMGEGLRNRNGKRGLEWELEQEKEQEQEEVGRVVDGMETPVLSEGMALTPGSEELEVREKMGVEWSEEELFAGSWDQDVMAVQNGFDPDVEHLIRDLFPEIYEENDMLKGGMEWMM